MATIDQTFARLQKSAFRAKFHLTDKDKQCEKVRVLWTEKYNIFEINEAAGYPFSLSLIGVEDYLGRYQDLYDEWKRVRHESVDIIDDVVFEIELIKQIEINIDYILMLVQKYHDTHCEDGEILITIRKAIDASPELRSKKKLIESFMEGINEIEDVMNEWHDFVIKRREAELKEIITTENLKPEDTRKYMECAFRDGEIKTVGTEIDRLLPPISRFGGTGNRAKKKQSVIEKFKAFFEKYFGIGGSSSFAEPEE